ncbi:MAG: glycine cleavage system protein [Candidatus Binatota bacterium]|nr:glycine cleavage system protein [Candidatus Binatota bacterium]
MRSPVEDVDTLRYTKDHLWVRVESGHARIGLSAHGQKALGDVIAVELPDIGDLLERGESFGEVESNRTVSDLLAPVSGRVKAINIDLEESPSLVNEDPNHEGWLVEVDLADAAELDDLIDADQYESMVADGDDGR